MFLCAAALPAAAQNVPRIKATVVAFDGSEITVKPEGDADTMKVGIRPATRIMKEEEKALTDIPAGSFVGATLVKSGSGYSAQEVHLFPDALKGSGEGLYPAAAGSNRFIADGTVTAVSAGSLSLKFRGAGGDGAKCTGRAPADPLQGCQGSVTFSVAAAMPVIALSPADKSLVKPGTVLAMSIMAGPNGRPVSPGFTIESVATPPVLPAPKPATRQTTPRTSKAP